MTINEYIKGIIKKDVQKFADYCVEELNSNFDTIMRLINREDLSFNFAVKILNDFAEISCELVDNESGDVEQIKSIAIPPELKKTNGKNQSLYFMFEQMADELWDFSGKSSDVLSREDIYLSHLEYCKENNLSPLTRHKLFGFIRDSIDLLDTSYEKVDFKVNNTRFFRGIRRIS